MTTDLPAGRELDALIAERIFGAKKRIVKWPLEDRLVFDWPDNHTCFERYLPNYSTDIGTAWEIIEEFNKRESDYNISELFYNQLKQQDIFLYLTQERAALAICRTALKAISEKEST